MTDKEPLSGLAIVVAQAVDMIAGVSRDEHNELYTDETATALVLQQRTAAQLPNPLPDELTAALAHLRRMQA